MSKAKPTILEQPNPIENATLGSMATSIQVTPIGWVRNRIHGMKEDEWGRVESRIELDPARFTAEALTGLDEFSHVEVLFHFSRLQESEVVTGLRHPRGNPAWPAVGIFAQRAKLRPNRIGATICRLVKVEGLAITVAGLDALDQTPVLDLKPVMVEFLPDQVRQPRWARELMSGYFR
jgi:tRNA (Thr-GGU) A37 N-methylase